MAISTNTFTISAGFSRSDCITQLESAFAWAGFHGDTVSGIVTGISEYSGGGSGTSIDYYDVRPSNSSRTVGIASTCSFFVDRSGGSVSKIYVNRPGSGYQNGDTFTLSTADTGGDVAIGITAIVDSTSYGSTSTFYSKNLSNTYPFGVLRLPVEANKVYGDTYFGFSMENDTSLKIGSGSGFMPYVGTHSNSENKTSGASTRFAGDEELDLNNLLSAVVEDVYNNGASTGYQNWLDDITICGDNSRDLELTAFKSGIDPKFVVYAYRVPSLTATYFTTRNYGCFFLHNFTTSLYDHNDVFCGGMTQITAESTTSASLTFTTKMAPAYDGSSYNDDTAKRAALNGFAGHAANNSSGYRIIEQYPAQTYPSLHSDYNENYFYYRSNTLGFSGSTSNASGTKLPDSTNYNAVIKGIPLCARMIPVPYYLPDDFVFINFDYATPNTFVDQFDTITISGSEVYTVISASYNKTTRTRGIAFCARTT